MRKILRGEEGIALITGMLVSVVVMTLSISAVTLAIHNTDASGYDRRRLMAITAAEGGIDAYYSLLASTAPSKLTVKTGSSSCVLTGTLPGSSTSSYTVTPTFYTTSTASTGGTACPQPAASYPFVVTPQYVVLSSVGSVAGMTAPVRTMQSKARLSVMTATAAFPGSAIWGASSITFSANVDLYAASGKNDANIYSNGDLTVNTRSSIRGSLYAQGSISIANGNFWARGDVWAKNAVTMTGGKVDGAAISSLWSSANTINISGNSYAGSAKAGGGISVTNPAKVYGSRSPNTAGIGDPPKASATYPTYTYNAADWPGIVTKTGASACTDANTAITNWTTGDLYIRLSSLTSPYCTMSPPAKVLPGNLGIISDGPISLAANTRFTTNSATPLNLYLFAGLAAVPGYCDFTAGANSGSGSNIKLLVYTPSNDYCNATFESNSSYASGQVFSGNVVLKSNAPLTFDSVPLPGSNGEPAGFLVDPVFKREVVTAG